MLLAIAFCNKKKYKSLFVYYIASKCHYLLIFDLKKIAQYAEFEITG